MFRENQAHLQENLFAVQRRFPKKVLQRLEKTIFPLFYEKLFCQIDESLFEGMYSQDQASRPNYPVNQLVGMELLKTLLDLSDEQLFEAVDLDIRFRVALGISTLEAETPSDRTLYNFRKRLRIYMNQEEGGKVLKTLFNDLTQSFLEEAKVKTDMIRMDSTQISSKMRKMSRAELMVQAMGKVIQKMSPSEQKALPEVFASLTTDEGIRKYLRNLPSTQDKLEGISQMMKDLLDLLKETPISETPAYALLKRIFEDQTICVEEQMVVKEGKEISPNACQSTTDPDATYISKGKKSFHGYSANLSETAHPDNPVQMITSVDVQPNTHSDRMFFEETLPLLKEEQGMDTLIVDAGYGGQDSADTANESNVTLIETAIKGTVPKTSAEDFVVNEEGIEKCPMGHTPIQSRIRKDQLQALFSHTDCEGCDHGACPVKKVAKGMKVTFSMDKYQKDLRRAALKDKIYQALARLRSAIEGKISSLKRCGLGRLQVVGLFRVRMVVTYSAIVSNLKQLFRYKTGKIRKKPTESVVCAT